MKEVLLSTQPKWCEAIGNNKKVIEIRKTAPKIELPFKVYIYCTYGDLLRKGFPTEQEVLKVKDYIKATREKQVYFGLNGKVIGEFICDGIQEYESEFWDDETFEAIGRVSYDMETGEREVFHFAHNLEDNYVCQKSGLSWEELRQYVGQGIKTFYGWHISNVTIYDKPKKLSEFRKPFPFNKVCVECERGGDSYSSEDCSCCEYWSDKDITRPPQSWCYVEG